MPLKRAWVAGLCLLATPWAAGFLTGCDQQTPERQTSGPQVVKTACGMEMVPIPAGQFTMGSDLGAIDAKPAHPVKVAAFLLDRYEITQEIYQRVTGSNPSRRKGPQNPVEQVTWTAAARFCNARSLQEGLKPCYDTNSWVCDFSANGYRLPTEAEWEYACRGGVQASPADSPDQLRSVAWFEANSPVQNPPGWPAQTK